MPAYLVSVPDLGGQTLLEGSNRAVVFAATAADALAVAKSSSGSDMNSAWGVATATEITASANYASYSLHCAVLDAATLIEITAPPTGISVNSISVNAGGAGYAANDVLTLVGGTSTRAGTVRVLTEAAGVVATVEVIDPGEYTVVPTATANAATGGTGAGVTLDVVASANSFESMVAAAVSLLNADAQIAGAAVDMGGVAPTLTIAAVADGIGDKTVLLEFLLGGIAQPSFVGTVTDKGVAAAVLASTLAAVPVPGKVVELLRS